ncbi:MAG TPA: LolA-related protein [Nitrospiraceae bacterium]|nr:LolA-related protein [Nitrospiraceae bacterium]
MNSPWNRFIRSSALLFALGLRVIVEAGDAPPLDLPQLMDLMAQVTARQDRFTETKTLAVLTKPLVLTGTLSYSRPDRVEKHVLTPYEEHLVVQGDKLTLVNKGGTKRIGVNSHPLIWSFVEAIRASLAGEVTALRRFYHVKLEGTRTAWLLTLRPLDPQAASYLTSITLRGRGNRLSAVEIREAGGDRSVMTIHEPVS